MNVGLQGFKLGWDPMIGDVTHSVIVSHVQDPKYVLTCFDEPSCNDGATHPKLNTVSLVWRQLALFKKVMVVF